MDPDSRVHKRVLLCESNAGIECGRAIPIANGNHRPHSSFPSASDDLLAIRVELPAVKMCVRIYEHDYLGTAAPAVPPKRKLG
jgi:hypothetical protein